MSVVYEIHCVSNYLIINCSGPQPDLSGIVAPYGSTTANLVVPGACDWRYHGGCLPAWWGLAFQECLGLSGVWWDPCCGSRQLIGLLVPGGSVHTWGL